MDPKPSHRDDRTNNDARAIQAQGFSTNPGIASRAPRPSSRASASRRPRSGPSPRIARVRSVSRWRAKACSSRSKPFWRCQPTARDDEAGGKRAPSASRAAGRRARSRPDCAGPVRDRATRRNHARARRRRRSRSSPRGPAPGRQSRRPPSKARGRGGRACRSRGSRGCCSPPAGSTQHGADRTPASRAKRRDSSRSAADHDVGAELAEEIELLERHQRDGGDQAAKAWRGR